MADELKLGRSVMAEMFDSVSVYFSDIVGFTRLASMCSPMEVVEILNELYSMFDGTIDKHQGGPNQNVDSAIRALSMLF